MIRKLTLVVAFGAGYVLGAKAGKQRYEQIKGTVQTVAAKPAVQSATEKVQSKAGDVAGAAKGKAVEKVHTVVETAKDKVHHDPEPTPFGHEPPGIVLDDVDVVVLEEPTATDPIR